jgi:hypothetical protein
MRERWSNFGTRVMTLVVGSKKQGISVVAVKIKVLNQSGSESALDHNCP